jgi:hypothetical protein
VGPLLIPVSAVIAGRRKGEPMAQAKIEFFDHEKDAVMELLLFAEDLFDLKRTKAPKRDPESGKSHLYIETVDHKKRTAGKGNP